MYVTDKKVKQWITSYLRYKYDVNIEPNRIYVFKNDYSWDMNRNEYVIRKYQSCVSNPFPESIPSKEVDDWGMILSRKEKIEKIRDNGSKQRVI
jgi:hypothetical protein